MHTLPGLCMHAHMCSQAPAAPQALDAALLQSGAVCLLRVCWAGASAPESKNEPLTVQFWPMLIITFLLSHSFGLRFLSEMQ